MRFRTKIETIFAVFIMISLLALSVPAPTRTISDTGDDVTTFIRNSNGNYWTATAANLQTAIDDLSNGGTIWLPGNTTFDIDTGYYISSTHGYDNINIIGAGNSTVIRYADNHAVAYQLFRIQDDRKSSRDGNRG